MTRQQNNFPVILRRLTVPILAINIHPFHIAHHCPYLPTLNKECYGQCENGELPSPLQNDRSLLSWACNISTITRSIRVNFVSSCGFFLAFPILMFYQLLSVFTGKYDVFQTSINLSHVACHLCPSPTIYASNNGFQRKSNKVSRRKKVTISSHHIGC